MCICDKCEMLNETVVYEEYKFSDSPFAETYLRARDGYLCLYTAVECVNKEDLSKYGCRLRG